MFKLLRLERQKSLYSLKVKGPKTAAKTYSRMEGDEMWLRFLIEVVSRLIRNCISSALTEA